MNRTRTGFAVASSAVAVLGARRVLRRRRGSQAAAGTTGWRVVTVNLPPAEVRGDEWPEPLRGWTPPLEITTRPAPGDRGTELAVRLTDRKAKAPDGLQGDTNVQQLRSALRRAKQLLETGEVLYSDRAFGTSRRTLPNAPLRAATRRAGAEGRR